MLRQKNTTFQHFLKSDSNVTEILIIFTPILQPMQKKKSMIKQKIQATYVLLLQQLMLQCSRQYFLRYICTHLCHVPVHW